MADFDLEMTDKLLSTTRSVRKRLDFDREVPREFVMDCLELGLQAPTGSNRQGWRWLVVTDEDKRRELGRLYRKGGDEYLAHSWAWRRRAKAGPRRMRGCSIPPSIWPRTSSAPPCT